jgi:hypothetical protein
MSPITHLLASWIIATGTTDNPRDRRLVTLAGLAPDLDGLGLISDLATRGFAHPTQFYARYHHYLFHGALGAAVTAILFATFARRHWRVAILCLVVFHLHLLCDLVGSRGPAPEDLWPIYYLGPFTHDPMWIWKYQWPLDAWPNRILSIVLLLSSFVIAVRCCHSIVGVFSSRGDMVFVSVLRRWSVATGARLWS